MIKRLFFITLYLGPCFLLAQLPEGEFFITATSTLPATSTSDFSPDNLMDGGSDSWSEGVAGKGIGEEIQLYTRYPDHLKYIMIKNGFGKERYWKANARVRELKIRTSSGREYFFKLKDTFSPQVVGLYEPEADAYGRLSAGEVPYDSAFTFTIMDVFPGDRWEDLCITEMGLNQWYYDAFQMDEEYISKCLLMDFLGGVLNTQGDLFYETGFEGLKQAEIIDGYLEKDILSGDGTNGAREYQVLSDEAQKNFYIFHSALVSEISQKSMEGQMDANGEPFRTETRTWGIALYDQMYGGFDFLEGEATDSLFTVSPLEAFSRKKGVHVDRDKIWLYVDTPGTIAATFKPVDKKHSPDTIYYKWNGGRLVLF